MVVADPFARDGGPDGRQGDRTCALQGVPDSRGGGGVELAPARTGGTMLSAATAASVRTADSHTPCGLLGRATCPDMRPSPTLRSCFADAATRTKPPPGQLSETRVVHH